VSSLIAFIGLAVLLGGMIYLAVFLLAGTRESRKRQYRRYAARRAEEEELRERYEREHNRM